VCVLLGYCYVVSICMTMNYIHIYICFPFAGFSFLLISIERKAQHEQKSWILNGKSSEQLSSKGSFHSKCSF